MHRTSSRVGLLAAACTAEAICAVQLSCRRVEGKAVREVSTTGSTSEEIGSATGFAESCLRMVRSRKSAIVSAPSARSRSDFNDQFAASVLGLISIILPFTPSKKINQEPILHVQVSLLGPRPEKNPGFCTCRKRDGGWRGNRRVAGPIGGLQ